MHNIRHYILLLICLLFQGATFSQQPAHLVLGATELSGTDIYHLIQDREYNYWLATDKGIIKYDGYDFISLTCPDVLGSSVFGWIEDSKGNLYCHNLSGQIFLVKDGACSVYFEIPDSLISSQINLSIDREDYLVVATNSIFRISPDRKLIMLREANKAQNRFTDLFKLQDGRLVIADIANHLFLWIDKGKIHIEEYKLSGDMPFISLSFFFLDSNLIIYEKNLGDIIEFAEGNMKLKRFIPDKRKGIFRFYSDNENLWVAQLSGGVQVFDKLLNPLYGGKRLIENEVVSTFYKDREGNILLGTFKGGIILIQNNALINITDLDPQAKMTRLTSTPEGVFVGTRDGRIVKINSKEEVSLFREKKVINIETLFYLTASNELITNDKSPLLINLKSGKEKSIPIGSIKDMEQVGKDQYLFATNNGLACYSPAIATSNQSFRIDQKISHLNYLKPDIFTLEDFKGRSYCVGFDPGSNDIYVGTPLGLKVGNEKGVEFIIKNGNSILAQDIHFANARIYVATQKFGVLVFHQRILEAQWDISNGLISNRIKKIKSQDELLFLSTEKGIQILDTDGKSVFILNESDGLLGNNIADFEIQNDRLWLAHKDGVQSISLDQLVPFNYQPRVIMKQIQPELPEVQESSLSEYTYKQNRFEFMLSSGSIKYQGDIQYHYLLEGIEENWQVNPYEKNLITYKSLPPGDYNFQVKVVCRGVESEVLESRFVINAAYWNTWNFRITMLLLFLALTFGAFILLVKRQKRKSELKNELIASKLTAIQSQMNPHFIFNALNSIQDLVLKGEVEDAYTFITKFAVHVRSTLNYSDKDFIEFEQEVKLIELYLELEKMRFKGDFEIEIIRNNIEDVLVPPLLIQPFVENALIHGLLPRTGEKKLRIEFVLKEYLECTITDNGIGRKKAQEIKARKGATHDSFSVKAMKRRFEILSDKVGGELGFEYEDLEENGIAIGTKVVLRIPVKRSF